MFKGRRVRGFIWWGRAPYTYKTLSTYRLFLKTETRSADRPSRRIFRLNVIRYASGRFVGAYNVFMYCVRALIADHRNPYLKDPGGGYLFSFGIEFEFRQWRRTVFDRSQRPPPSSVSGFLLLEIRLESLTADTIRIVLFQQNFFKELIFPKDYVTARIHERNVLRDTLVYSHEQRFVISKKIVFPNENSQICLFSFFRNQRVHIVDYYLLTWTMFNKMTIFWRTVGRRKIFFSKNTVKCPFVLTVRHTHNRNCRYNVRIETHKGIIPSSCKTTKAVVRRGHSFRNVKSE